MKSSIEVQSTRPPGSPRRKWARTAVVPIVKTEKVVEPRRSRRVRSRCQTQSATTLAKDSCEAELYQEKQDSSSAEIPSVQAPHESNIEVGRNVCQICSKGFTLAESLRVHMWVHRDGRAPDPSLPKAPTPELVDLDISNTDQSSSARKCWDTTEKGRRMTIKLLTSSPISVPKSRSTAKIHTKSSTTAKSSKASKESTQSRQAVTQKVKVRNERPIGTGKSELGHARLLKSGTSVRAAQKSARSKDEESINSGTSGGMSNKIPEPNRKRKLQRPSVTLEVPTESSTANTAESLSTKCSNMQSSPKSPKRQLPQAPACQTRLMQLRSNSNQSTTADVNNISKSPEESCMDESLMKTWPSEASSSSSCPVNFDATDTAKASELRKDFRAWLAWRKVDSERAAHAAAAAEVRKPTSVDDPTKYKLTDEGVVRRNSEIKPTFRSMSAKEGIDWMQTDPASGIV